MYAETESTGPDKEHKALPPQWSITDYLHKRVDGQIAWYSKKSSRYKMYYYSLQSLALVAAASIPVIVLSMTGDASRLLVAVIGAITAITTGVLSLFGYHDLWVNYRITAENLKREKYLYLTRTHPYEKPIADSMFVAGVEALLAQEKTVWFSDRQAANQVQNPELSDGGNEREVS